MLKIGGTIRSARMKATMPPFDNAELEYEVGGCHLESHSSREVRAFAGSKRSQEPARCRSSAGCHWAVDGSSPGARRLPERLPESRRTAQSGARGATGFSIPWQTPCRVRLIEPSNQPNRLSGLFPPTRLFTTRATCNPIWSAVRRIDSLGPQRKILGVMRQLRSHKRRPQRSGFLWPAR